MKVRASLEYLGLSLAVASENGKSFLDHVRLVDSTHDRHECTGQQGCRTNLERLLVLDTRGWDRLRLIGLRRVDVLITPRCAPLVDAQKDLQDTVVRGQ